MVVKSMGVAKRAPDYTVRAPGATVRGSPGSKGPAPDRAPGPLRVALKRR